MEQLTRGPGAPYPPAGRPGGAYSFDRRGLGAFETMSVPAAGRAHERRGGEFIRRG